MIIDVRDASTMLFIQLYHKHCGSIQVFFFMYEGPDFELKCINSIRALSADMPSAAKSGHPGAPMGCAPLAHLLWSEVMNYSPVYELTMEDLKQFRQLGSLTPGHPCLNIQCP